jgi:hypothetical protein
MLFYNTQTLSIFRRMVRSMDAASLLPGEGEGQLPRVQTRKLTESLAPKPCNVFSENRTNPVKPIWAAGSVPTYHDADLQKNKNML